MSNELKVLDVISSELLPIEKADNDQISRYLVWLDQRIKADQNVKDQVKEYVMKSRFKGDKEFGSWEIRQVLKKSFNKTKAPLAVLEDYNKLVKQEEEIKEKLKAIETLYSIENVTYSWYPPKY